MTAHDDAVKAAAEAMRSLPRPMCSFGVCPDCDRERAEAAVTAAAPILLAGLARAIETTGYALIRAEADRDEAVAANSRRIAAALALHQRVVSLGHGIGCSVCGVPMVTFGNPNPAPTWPCATVRALTDAGDDATGTGEAS